MTKFSETDIIRELINDDFPVYQLYQKIFLSFSLFFTFSVTLFFVFSYLSYDAILNTFIVISVLLGIFTLFSYMAFSTAQKKYNNSYHLYQREIEDILYTYDYLSKSMIIWIFITRKKNHDWSDFTEIFHFDTIYSELLLNSMKNDINDIDCKGNTLLHYILKYNQKKYSNEDYNHDDFCKMYVSHALLLGADIDIANDHNITVRNLLSKNYPEFISIFEEIEISKSFKK